ncbi:unnamed protein product (macronuclear) [Paramecium tetraurelia]|uniref:Uncharacterized protein n=1 Tax=Paramecium tetraurelia TaxID=5888 RepID=A0D4N2_PARTE|nr:uncharacterized protein GSPATT00013446001 [Paramecium tetraurelia]CAK77999.1 unnamed protein product [Paramecium tetraurelia]|eukprot:XP_001445396.1 hypothetical protein (macronuclear) [Paramecium tetraurelia strain d4-2]
MQNLILSGELKCKEHQKNKDNLNLAQHVQDDRQLRCDQCNFNGVCQIKLLDLEKFLLEFNNQIKIFTQEIENTKKMIMAAKKITELVSRIENELIEIEGRFLKKNQMNQNIQAYLNYNLDESRLKELLQYLKNCQIDDYKVKSNKSLLEKEVLQQRKCISALNIIQMAQEEINNILAYQATVSDEKEQTLSQVYLFDKQVEQDFDHTGLLLAVGSNRIESDDCYAQIWEIDGGVLRKSDSLKGHQREVKSLFFNKEDTLFTGSVDSTIKIWVKQQDTNKWDLKQDLNNFHSLAVNCIQLHYFDPKFFASGSEELIIWKKDLLQHGQWVQDSVFKNNKRIISALSFTDKGNLLIVGSDDRLIQILEFAHNQWKLKQKFDQSNKIMQIIPTYNRDFISFQIDGEYTFWKCKSENNELSWNQKKNKHGDQIKKLSVSLAKKLLSVTYEDKKNKLFQIELDGKLSEKQLDNNEGEIMIMSYMSPSKIVQQPINTMLGNRSQDGIFPNNIKDQFPQQNQQIFGGKQFQPQGAFYASMQGRQQGGAQGQQQNFTFFYQNQQNVKGTGGQTQTFPINFNPVRIQEMTIEQSKFVKVSKGKLQVYMERSKKI